MQKAFLVTFQSSCFSQISFLLKFFKPPSSHNFMASAAAAAATAAKVQEEQDCCLALLSFFQLKVKVTAAKTNRAKLKQSVPSALLFLSSLTPEPSIS